ncbi:type II secretion system protein GspM [Agrobacterium sp. 22117]|uniref:type II secretion system protein GspM n=1 Tax=Agrobacterium sp. 22117 TaxID=3453880 RepID=UPI003F8667BD
MTEFLIKVMNMPRIVQRSIAVIVLLFSSAVVVAFAMVLWFILVGKASRIHEMRTELSRLEQVIALRPRNVTPEKSRSELLFLDGDSVAIIQARLQERVNAAADNSGASVVSIGGMQPVEINGASYVGVRADFEGSMEAFHNVIRDLEITQPPLIILKTTIRSTNITSQGELSGPLQLSGQITVYGAANPTADLTEKGGS